MRLTVSPLVVRPRRSFRISGTISSWMRNAIKLGAIMMLVEERRDDASETPLRPRSEIHPTLHLRSWRSCVVELPLSRNPHSTNDPQSTLDTIYGQTSGRPDIKTSRHPDIQTSRHPDIQTSRRPGVQVTGHLQQIRRQIEKADADSRRRTSCNATIPVDI